MKKRNLIGAIIIILVFLISIILTFYPEKNDLENRTGIISLTFDDRYLTQYETAYPEMKEYGYNGTLYILANLSFFEGRELMSFKQAKEMQDNGWEVGSHTLKHKRLTMLSDDELKKDLRLSKEILENEGFEIKTLAFPGGHYNGKVINETKKNYLASRALTEGYNNLSKIDFYNLRTKWLVIKKSPEEICSWIEYTQKEGLWFILTFHSVEPEAERPFDTSVKTFKEILNCINSSGINVKTIKEVINLYEKKD